MLQNTVKNEKADVQTVEGKHDGQSEMKRFSLEMVERSISVRSEMMSVRKNMALARLMCSESVDYEVCILYYPKAVDSWRVT